MEGAPHKCAAIFIDNSGIDFVLGVLPFARELLRRGTKVLFTVTDYSMQRGAILYNELRHSLLTLSSWKITTYGRMLLALQGRGNNNPCHATSLDGLSS